ncbi:methyltransferase [Flavobacterium sedimenticola]|uniref:Methyltransferase n=1 Tax=Flavobacterium sedimenticola TaxID=3043286 RepID=A0ABT6XLW4_9FLAO|nr:methyltransferase [Flavobacterium sedimenticola]MDI9255842.1 methyltransferase [Flavobacterium sedimenticola]
MRSFIQRVTHPFLKLGLQLYYWKPRNFTYDSITVKIHPDVFPPQLTFSTKILLDFIQDLDLQNKTLLELGCGSGIISLLATKKGAQVTASDINQTALAFLVGNAEKNHLTLTTIYSDLFQNIKNRTFHYIIINPPYYPKQPRNVKEQAWFCGENFEYFEKLFRQLPSYLSPKTSCFMILSQDCDIEKIKAMAFEKNMAFELVMEKKTLAETNFIFNIISS